MSDLVRSEVEAALASGVELVGDSPQLLTVFGEMQTHGKTGRWLVFPLRNGRKVSAAARAWLAEGDATPETGSLSTPTEPTGDWQPTCCKGKEAECRLHQIAALSRNELMDALVQCEEELMMVESYIEDHVCGVPDV